MNCYISICHDRNYMDAATCAEIDHSIFSVLAVGVAVVWCFMHFILLDPAWRCLWHPPWSKAGSDTLAGCLVQHHSWTYSHDPMLTSLSSFSSLTSTSELGSSFSSFPSLHPFYKRPDGLDCSCFPQDIYRPCFQLDVRRYLHVNHIYTLCPQPHPAPVHIFHCPSPMGNMFRA